ncbi:MAG: phosphoribosylglycinamide formyltransferase [Lachnospiraceae bacterium]|nr:phosphoribosylglycinamide formyltransferase [Lachnospiraceae bacterium]
MRAVVMVSGGGTNLQAILDAIRDGKITNTEICGVISNRPDAYALTRAQKAGVPAICVSRKSFETRQEFADALLAAVDSCKPDLIVLAGFLVIIPEEMIRRYEGKIINIHPSLIPSFCGDGFYGLHVHERVLARGVKVTGATVHFVDEGTDTGPILLQKAVAIEPDDTPEVLQRRVMEQAEWQILPKAIDAIANGRIRKDANGNWFVTE